MTGKQVFNKMKQTVEEIKSKITQNESLIWLIWFFDILYLVEVKTSN